MTRERFQAIAELYRAGKAATSLAALKAAVDPKPPAPPGAPQMPTDPDGPFFDSTTVARFIVSANEHRLRGCPAAAPSGDDETSKLAALMIEMNERRLGRART